MKKQEQVKETKRINKSRKSSRKLKRPSIFSILFIVITILATILICFAIKYLWITIKYKDYKVKMDWYGLNELYDNGSARSTGKVTNSEMIKVIIGSIKNEKDVNYVNYFTDPSYENEAWVDYANNFSLINKDQITVDNQSNKASDLDAILVLSKAINHVLEKDVELTEVKFKNINEFNEDDKKAIGKAISLELIKNKRKKISANNLTKGELNKMIINIVEKYSTMYYDVENSQGKVITDKEKLPENYKSYPYIVDEIDNKIYEMSFKEEIPEFALTPKEVYKKRGQIYGQIDDLVTSYFRGILNIDYTTITKEDILNKIGDLTLYVLNDELVEEYVKYVKDNKIKIEGNAKPLLPIIYYTGEQNILRVKVSFKIVNAETNENLLFGDSLNFKNVQYDGKEYSFYIDMPLGITVNSISLRVITNPVATLIISENVAIKVIE